MYPPALIQRLIDAAKGLSRETHHIRKNVKNDFSLMNAEAYLDKVLHEVDGYKAPALPPNLSAPWKAEDGFVYSSAGLRVADCHCDDQPDTEAHESDLAVIIAEAVNMVFGHATVPDTSPPPKINSAYSDNFETMLRAADDGNLMLVSARYNDGKPAVLVCARQTNADKTITPVPFAVMIDGNPFEMFQDPTKDAH